MYLAGCWLILLKGERWKISFRKDPSGEVTRTAPEAAPQHERTRNHIHTGSQPFSKAKKTNFSLYTYQVPVHTKSILYYTTPNDSPTSRHRRLKNFDPAVNFDAVNLDYFFQKWLVLPPHLLRWRLTQSIRNTLDQSTSTLNYQFLTTPTLGEI